MGDGLRRNAWKFPLKIAAKDRFREISYGELNARVNQLAHALLSMGVCKGDGVALSLEYRDGIAASVTIEPTQDGSFQLVWTATGDRTAFMRLAPDASADEGFYGLGEYFDAVDHRGSPLRQDHRGAVVAAAAAGGWVLPDWRAVVAAGPGGAAGPVGKQAEGRGGLRVRKG